jgi:hypothetical protein
MKKIEIKSRPSANMPLNADAWVKDRAVPEAERQKRLTFDIPQSLHARIKSQCAMQGLVMADVLRDLLNTHFPSEGKGRRES